MSWNPFASFQASIDAVLKQEQDRVNAQLAFDREIAAAKTSAPKSGIEATSLKFGFLGITKNYLHISNIKIITDEGLDISKACDFTSTSVYKEFSWSPLLKDTLVDPNKDTYMHTNNGDREHITVDFKKRYTIKQVIIQNRMDCCQDRIIGTSFRLFNDSKIVYDSDTITKTNAYYYVLPNDVKIYLGQPPDVVLGIAMNDPNDPCNDVAKVNANAGLKTACDCKTGLKGIEKSFLELKQNKINNDYIDEVARNTSDWEKKINAFQSWGNMEKRLKEEKVPFKLCRRSRVQGGMFSSEPIAHSTWAGYCVQDYGPGWDAVPLSEPGSYCDYYSGCSKAPWNYTTYAQCENGVAGLCRRTNNLVAQELENAGYIKSKPSDAGSKKDISISNNVVCCSMDYSNLKADSINFNNIKQECNLTINNQINEALKPPTPPPATTPPPAATPPPASTPPPATTPPKDTTPPKEDTATPPTDSTPPPAEEESIDSSSTIILIVILIVVFIAFVAFVRWLISNSESSAQPYPAQSYSSQSYSSQPQSYSSQPSYSSQSYATPR